MRCKNGQTYYCTLNDYDGYIPNENTPPIGTVVRAKYCTMETNHRKFSHWEILDKDIRLLVLTDEPEYVWWFVNRNSLTPIRRVRSI